MAISKVNFNSLNLTPTASKTVVFNSSNNGIEAGDVGGALVLISEQTASSSATIDFTSGIDSTYKEYIFKFIDIHPATQSGFTVNFRDGGSDFDATKTTTCFNAQHNEADSSTNLGYESSVDLAQSTSDLILDQGGVGTDNDACLVGTLHLFEPASTTFVKHFISTTQHYYASSWSMNTFVAGYCNTTTAIDGVRFKFASGNIDSGTIKMYGVT